MRTYLSRADESRIVIYSFVGCFSESFFSFRNCSLIGDVLAVRTGEEIFEMYSC